MIEEELTCPICGDDYVHIESVRIITGELDTMVDCNGLKAGCDKSSLDRAKDMRGAIIEIGIWCENGWHRGTIEYAFRKGQTSISHLHFKEDNGGSDLWRD